MPVFFAKSHHNDIGGGNAIAGTDGVDIGALVVMPELVGFGPEDVDTAIIACLMIGDRPGKIHIQTGGACDDPVTPV